MKPDLKLFQKLCSFPFLLILLAFLFPLVYVSCSEKVVADPNLYQLVAGVTPESFLEGKEKSAVEEMKKKEPRVQEFFEQPIQTSQAVIPILGAVILGAIFAFVTPLGSLAMALAAFVSLWVFIHNFTLIVISQHYDFLTVEPAVGAYCISFLLAIAIAMNLTVIIKSRKQKKLKMDN